MNSLADLPKHQQDLIRWSSEMSHWIAKVLDACRPDLGPVGKLDDTTKLTLWQLTASCHSTSESALLLVSRLRLWDADILVRSVVEGTLKFVFLTCGNEAERKQKLFEFVETFSAIGQLKKHQRLEELLKVIPDPSSYQWRPYRDLLLKPEAIDEIRKKFPRKERQFVEQKWSFAEISASLKAQDSSSLKLFGHLLFNYGMSSHVAHQDIDGIGMVWDRNNRDDRRVIAVELAHGARLVSDISAMSTLRASMLFSLVGRDLGPLKQLNEELNSFQNESSEAAKLFHDIEYGNSAS